MEKSWIEEAAEIVGEDLATFRQTAIEERVTRILDEHYLDYEPEVPDVWGVLTLMRDEIQATYDTSSTPGAIK